MKSKFLLFTATLFLLFNFSHAQTPVFVIGKVSYLAVSNGKLFLEAGDNEAQAQGLWISDGTTAGTKLLKELRITGRPNYTEPNYTEYNGKTYFLTRDAESYAELWTTDGTSVGTYLVKNLKPAKEGYAVLMTVYNNKMYFIGMDAEYGRELWVSDGTEGGTKLFKDINPGVGDSFGYGYVIVFKNKMFFSARDTKGNEELWVSDGSETGTYMLKDIGQTNEYDPGAPFAYNGKAYFISHGHWVPYKLWVTDGTTGGTSLLEENVGYKIVATDVGLLFSKIISTTGGSDNYALYKTNGEPGGASLVKAIEGGTSSGYPVHFRAANGKWYFAIYDNKDDYDYSNIWETDGTSENTKLVRGDQGNLLEEDREYDLISYNNALFFVMADENSGSSLYRLGSPSTAITEVGHDDFEVVLFPNPAKNQLTIKTNEKLSGSNYVILNITGHTVHSGKINSNNTVLEVGDLPGGIYMVQIQSGNGGFTSRFIKE